MPKNMSKTSFQVKHGMTGTSIYTIWQSMLKRCFNKNCREYKYYGMRGITVCDHWFWFENFFADMGDRPHGLTLDRINNDGNYEPDNCRWATWKEQSHNNRHTKFLTFRQQTFPVGEWEIRLGLSQGAIYRRLKRGWTLEKSLANPKMERWPLQLGQKS